MADKPVVSQAEHHAMIKRAVIGKVIEVLGLRQRIPELLRARGWPHEDLDLVACLALAVALKRLGAGKQALKRPDGARIFADKWPEIAYMTAERAVEELELEDLLQAK